MPRLGIEPATTGDKATAARNAKSLTLILSLNLIALLLTKSKF